MVFLYLPLSIKLAHISTHNTVTKISYIIYNINLCKFYFPSTHYNSSKLSKRNLLKMYNSQTKQGKESNLAFISIIRKQIHLMLKNYPQKINWQLFLWFFYKPFLFFYFFLKCNIRKVIGNLIYISQDRMHIIMS